jgi:XRE family transcriptional regulator, regulator of sulfur utilization
MSDNAQFDFSVIRTLRLKKQLTAEQLAQKAGITRATIAKIEGGDGNPTLDTIRALSSVFQMPSSELIRLAEVARCEEPVVKSFGEKGIDVHHIWFPGFEIYRIRAGTGFQKLADPKYHENTAEVCLVLSGRISIAVAGQLYELGPGMAMRFKALQEHQFNILEDADFLMMHHN